MKKIRIPSEAAYLFSIVIMSFSVAMSAAADFGLSMIPAPAYILSLKVDFLTFGYAEYVLQGLLFIALCIVLRKVKITYLFSFVTCLLYGAFLDFWRRVIPIFNPDITPPGSMAMPLRIVFFVSGMLITALGVALSFRPYFFPQVYDFFVNALRNRFDFNLTKFKLIYDSAFLAVSVAMSLLFFGRFNGIGIGTVILTVLNGPILGLFDKLLTKYFEFYPISKKLEKLFEM